MSTELAVDDNKTPVTLITGGSEGIGRLFADMFAKQGETLFLVARNQNRLRIAADELENKWNIRVHILAIDLMEQGAAPHLLQHINQQGLYVDTLINSAAIAFMGTFTDSDISGIRSLIQLNITTTTELTHECIIGMLKRGKGGVMNIASLGGLLPMPNLALYSASKSYLISLTRALAEELRDSPVRISVVVPGPVDTSFIQHGGTGIQKFAPMLTPASVAKVGYEGFIAGRTVITPGFLGALYRLGIKLIPHKLLLRMLNPLLKKIYVE